MTLRSTRGAAAQSNSVGKNSLVPALLPKVHHFDHFFFDAASAPLCITGASAASSSTLCTAQAAPHRLRRTGGAVQVCWWHCEPHLLRLAKEEVAHAGWLWYVDTVPSKRGTG